MTMTIIITTMALSGCASSVVKATSPPDQSALAPAEKALAKARAAQADTFAPRTVDGARRRIATARDILYAAAAAQRSLSADQGTRVDQLVAAAELDARAAFVETQAKAVRSQLRRLRRLRRDAVGTGAGNTKRATDMLQSSGALGMSP